MHLSYVTFCLPLTIFGEFCELLTMYMNLLFSNLRITCSSWLSLLYTGNRLVWRLPVLGSMNIFTVPIAMYWDTSYDKCTYCKSLWIKASAKCPKCKCKLQQHLWVRTIWAGERLKGRIRPLSPLGQLWRNDVSVKWQGASLFISSVHFGCCKSWKTPQDCLSTILSYLNLVNAQTKMIILNNNEGCCEKGIKQIFF